MTAIKEIAYIFVYATEFFPQPQNYNQPYTSETDQNPPLSLPQQLVLLQLRFVAVHPINT